MGDLAADTQVAGDAGRYTARLSRAWEIWGPNGGYLAAIALRAAGAHSRFDHPASIVGHFLGVARFDEVQLDVTTLRAAKRAESMRVSMTQQGEPVFEALVWTTGDVNGLEHDRTTFPATFEPESVPSSAERIAAAGGESMYPFWDNFDQRTQHWYPTPEEWERRLPSNPTFEQWLRYVPTATFDDPWVDACRSLILIDTLGWPATCNLHVGGAYVAPSIDLACAFHRTRPDEPWLFAQAHSSSAGGGLVGCEARVWSRDGTLLAVGSSQLLCRPAPPR